MLDGSYTPWLVVVSLLVAMLASFTALDMANRITTAPSARLSTLSATRSPSCSRSASTARAS